MAWCAVCPKKFEESGQVAAKMRGNRHKKPSIADEQCMKVMLLRNRQVCETKQMSGSSVKSFLRKGSREIKLRCAKLKKKTEISGKRSNEAI